MNSNEAIFRDTPIGRTIAHMAIPSMISSLVTIVYNLADTFFVGQTKDTFQVAAVSFVQSVFIMYMATGFLIGLGGSALVSILLGEQKQHEVKQVSAFCCYASLIISAVFGALILVFMDPLIRLLGCNDAQSHAFTKDYLYYIALGSPFVLFSATFGHVIRGEGAAQASMMGNIVGTVVNIILDPLFILVLHMGTAGAAIATVIGNIFASGYYLWYVVKKSSLLSLNPKFLRSCKSLVKRELVLGAPSGASAALRGVAVFFIIRALAGYGDIPVAAMGIVLKASLLIELVQEAIANGVMPALGYNYGAKNMTRLKGVLKFSVVLTFVLGVVLAAAYIVFSRQIIRFFIDNAAVIENGVPMLIALSLSGPMFGLLFLCISTMQAVERSVPATALSFFRQGLLIVLLYALDAAFGFNGVISAQTAANYIALIAALIAVRVVFRKGSK
jgi:putative MATE family efflux protein